MLWRLRPRVHQKCKNENMSVRYLNPKTLSQNDTTEGAIFTDQEYKTAGKSVYPILIISLADNLYISSRLQWHLLSIDLHGLSKTEPLEMLNASLPSTLQ